MSQIGLPLTALRGMILLSEDDSGSLVARELGRPTC